MIGGWLLHVITVICMSRMTYPTKIPFLNSSILMAMLNSPANGGTTQVTSPVEALMLKTSDPFTVLASGSSQPGKGSAPAPIHGTNE